MRMCKFLCWPNLDFTHNQTVGLRCTSMYREQQRGIDRSPPIHVVLLKGSRGDRGIRNEEVKVNLGKRKRSLILSLLLTIQIYFNRQETQFVFPSNTTEISKWSTCLFLNLRVFVSCALSCWGGGVRQQPGGQLAKVNPPQSLTEEQSKSQDVIPNFPNKSFV